MLLVEQDASIIRGLRMALELEPDVLVVGEADCCCTALALARSLQPDILLTEILPADRGGIVCASDIAASAPCCAVVVLSLEDDSAGRSRACAAGAVAFVGKHEPYASLLSAIREAAHRRRSSS